MTKSWRLSGAGARRIFEALRTAIGDAGRAASWRELIAACRTAENAGVPHSMAIDWLRWVLINRDEDPVAKEAAGFAINVGMTALSDLTDLRRHVSDFGGALTTMLRDADAMQWKDARADGGC